VPTHSILFERPDENDAPVGEPACFFDLHLDQIVQAVVAGREPYDLGPLFYRPLTSASAVRYRHDVQRDLEQPDVLEAVRTFAEQMRLVRDRLGRAEKAHHALESQRWFLDAVRAYCAGVGAFGDRLGQAQLGSRGLDQLRAFLHDYTGSLPFGDLASESEALIEALGSIRYAVQIKGGRVRVTPFDDEPDYGAAVRATFAKFEQGAVGDHRVRVPSWAGLDPVEARIVELVARLQPDVFGRLAAVAGERGEFVDPTIERFDREVQLYLAFHEYRDRVARRGLAFCYPTVSETSRAVAVEDGFDLALASKLVADGAAVVTNDVRLEGAERTVVVTGPNQGGKTTFARAFGQLHYLAALGLPVPAAAARLPLFDELFTHFEREEAIETLRGKLEDELVRIHDVLERATGRSVIVMNESFTSTTLQDALFLGTQVLGRIGEVGCLAVYVTFVDELASLNESTVSMVACVVPEDPARRTYRIVRRPAEGLAYAWAIAEKYRVTYDRLWQRVRT
jgi:hypothetical protein